MVGLLKKAGLAVLFLVGLSACDKSVLDGERTADQGSLVARLHTVPGVSKAAQVELEAPPIERFVVAVRSAAAPAEPVYTSLFSEFPYSINLTEGSYTIEADQGQNLPFVTENPYYRAQQSFTIERGEATSVELKARLVGFGVEGFFDADMADHFASWQLEAEIDDVWDESYRWAEQGNKPRAYFLPGTVRVILRGVRHNGEPFSKVIKEIRSTGRELYTLNIHVSPAGHALSVLVDTERRLVTDQGVVSVDALPDLESPTLGAMTFYETTTVPADGLAAMAELHSFVGFSQVTITVPKAAYGLEARAYRWSDGADRAALRAAGVDLGADDLSAVLTATLSAKGLVNNMLADASVEREYDMQVDVTDGTGKASRTTLPIRIERPEFRVVVPRGNLWSKTIELNELTYSVAEGKGSSEALQISPLVGYELSADQGVSWRAVSEQEWADQKITGLTAGTPYLFRGTYRGTPSLTTELTTEAAPQIPNSNFQANHATNGNQPCYWFFANGAAATDQWWATRNSKTTSEGNNNHYSKYSGARPTSGQGVELVTHGWGSGNTSSWGSSMIYNIWAGAVYLGVMNDGAEVHGKPFSSRPTAMKFDYKYAPYNNKGDKYVAKIWLEHRAADGEVTSLASGLINNEGASVSSWSSKTINLIYTNTTLPITHLCVAFYSGVNDKAPDIQNNTGWVADPGGWADNNPSRGSVFNVNNVTLVYDK